MKKSLAIVLLLSSNLILSACGGNSQGATSQTSAEIPYVKKIINTDNLEQAFSSYLLFRYRVTTELDALVAFERISNYSQSGDTLCPMGGKVLNAGDFVLTFTDCAALPGKILSGKINRVLAAGPLHSFGASFSELVFQLNDDAEHENLTGSYSYVLLAGNKRFSYSLIYTQGTASQSYTTDYTNYVVALESTANSGNQSYQLAQADMLGVPITPVLNAKDGSNLTMLFDVNGSVNLNLRNEKNGAVILQKTYTAAEVDKLLAAARNKK